MKTPSFPTPAWMLRVPMPLLSLLLLFAALPVCRADSLSDTLDKILDIPALKGGVTGAIVERVSDGHVLYARDADTRLMPASNRKLFTSAAALERLGDNFTFTTDALTSSKPDSSGVIHGDIYLRGVGDSLLSPFDLDALAKAMAKSGITRIDGSVIGDGSYFGDGPYGVDWSWDYLSDYYAPQICGLEVSQGVLAVHVTPGATVGAPVAIAVDQPTAYLPIVNNTTTGAKDSSPDNCYIHRPWNQNILIVAGTVPLGGKADGVVTVAEPDRYAATVFTETLVRDGIAVTGTPFTSKTPAAASIVLASHTSIPLSAYIARMNKPSNNLLAESLVRVLGAVKGHGGTYWSGHAVETPFFQSLGIDTRTIQLTDGSGMSRLDLVTPRSVAQLLRAMHEKPDWKTYEDSLPIAGVDGSLRNRMKGTKAQANVHAKTGSLGAVSSLSGYVTGPHGDLYVFSLIMNNYLGSERDVLAAQNNFAVTLATNP